MQSIENVIRKILFIFVEIFWKLLSYTPMSIRTHLLEYGSNKNIGFLDYHKHIIKLCVSSQVELMRLKSCEKEPGTVQWIEQYFKQNDVFFDVGANIGAYSFIAHAVTNGKMKIYSFEPGLSTYTELCRNVILNNFQNSITPLNFALSSETNFKLFSYQNLISGEARHTGLEKNLNSRELQNSLFNQLVQTYTIDQLINESIIPCPTHIKIDVDGHEYSILKGAIATLKKSTVKSLQIEVEKNSSESIKILNLLQRCGFHLIKKNQHFSSNIYDYIFKK